MPNMPKKKSKSTRMRMSILLPSVYIEAMNLVYGSDRVKKSHQVELGLRLYLEKHRKLLEDNGLDVWTNKP